VRRGKRDSLRVRRATVMASAPSIARLVAAHEDTVHDVTHLFNKIGLRREAAGR
jgi:hypothetical protein